MRAFWPTNAATVNIDVGASTANVKVAGDGSQLQVRVMNNGTATAWIAYGDSSITASLTTSIPVGPGVTEVLTMQSVAGTPLYVAAIAAGGTGKIYFTPGAGI